MTDEKTDLDGMETEEASEDSEVVEEPETLLKAAAKPEEKVEEDKGVLVHEEDKKEPEKPKKRGGGPGRRPNYMPEQFWSTKEGAQVKELAEAYNSLRTKMDQGKHKVPKEYDMGVVKDYELDEEDELLGVFTRAAKEHGLTQDAYDSILGLYLQAASEHQDLQEASLAEERKKLGRNADAVIEETNRWLTRLHHSGVLSDDEVASFEAASKTATFVRALNKVRASYNEAPIPATPHVDVGPQTTEDLEEMVADPRYGDDQAYTKKVENAFRAFYHEQG